MKTRLFIISILLFSVSLFAQNIPAHVGYVNDYANILSSQTKASLEQAVLTYEKQSSIEIAIVTVSDLQGVQIEEYCLKLATEWGVGKKHLDNGLVMFVSTDLHHRGFRIEVGYGLEGRMPDITANQITSSTVQNYFKRSAFNEGMTFALGKVLGVLGPETKEQYDAYQAQKQKEHDEAVHAFWQNALFIGMSIGAIALVVLTFYLLFRSYMKRKKEEEERLQHETETKSIQVSMIKDLSALSYSLTTLESSGFFGAKDAIQLCESTKKYIAHFYMNNLTTSFEYDAIRSEIQKKAGECQKVVDVVKQNRRIENEILADKGKFTNAKELVENLIDENKSVADEVTLNNPKSVWTRTPPEVLPSVAFKSAKEYAVKAEELYDEAVALLGKNKFDEADKAHKGGLVYIEKAFQAANYPTNLKNELAEKKKTATETEKKIKALKENALKSIEQEHVNATTKKMVDKIPSLEKANDGSVLDWFLACAAVTALYEYLQKIITTADGDVQSYHDAVRRKREEAEEEERRARRRREESSYSSYGYGSGGGSSYGGSSGGDSFGGGSFGGGGSTSTW